MLTQIYNSITSNEIKLSDNAAGAAAGGGAGAAENLSDKLWSSMVRGLIRIPRVSILSSQSRVLFGRSVQGRLCLR